MLGDIFFCCFFIKKWSALRVLPKWSISTKLVAQFCNIMIRICSSGTSGTLITVVVVGDVEVTTLAVAGVPHKPSFFDHLLTFRASFNSKDFSVRGIDLLV